MDQLPVAEGASFDSHADEHNPICLQGTRAEVLGDISRWISDPTAKSIFWLNGMAGTGKSTISRTIARQRFKAGNLGASFFFKKGESDRVTLAKFVPTLARQLASSVPHVAGHIKKAIDSDSNIIHRNIEQQFKKLILGPLSEINKSNGKPSTLVIVLDALDECERDQDIELLIELLSKFQGSTSLNLRIFVTSRPEVPIRLGFGAIEGTYQNLVLHEIAASTVRHDIACFLRHELEKTRTKFNRGRPGQPIASNWPKESDLDKLVTIAEPLFISAATICRFVSDHKRGNPQRQLNNFLRQSRQSHGSQLGKIYGPILNQQLDEEMSVDELQQILREFRLIVGAIITIYDPLSALNLAKLLNIPSDVVDDRLDMLQSIFSVPSNREMPIRFLHLSIRDYLVDPQGKGVNEFWIDQSRVHANLTKQCLRIMQHREHGLRKDKCQLRKPWITHKEVDPKRIEKFIPNELRYACRYWVDHAILNTLSACDAEKISDFLRLHFMHWLEVCLWIQVPGAEYPEAALLVLRDCDQVYSQNPIPVK